MSSKQLAHLSLTSSDPAMADSASEHAWPSTLHFLVLLGPSPFLWWPLPKSKAQTERQTADMTIVIHPGFNIC